MLLEKMNSHYALGLMAKKLVKRKKCKNFFQKSIKEKYLILKFEVWLTMKSGKFFEDNDYLSAGVYYDSAYAAMNYALQKKN